MRSESRLDVCQLRQELQDMWRYNNSVILYFLKEELRGKKIFLKICMVLKSGTEKSSSFYKST